MAKPPAVTAHQEEPRTLGGKLPGLLADVLAHNRSFLDALEQQRPLTFEGNVTALQRDNTGVNRVQVQRTGQSASEAAWYTVWGTFYVPAVGDQVRLLIVGRGAAVLLGAKHGGRPNEWTVAYSGGALRTTDASAHALHKHGDDHSSRHYRTDGTTIAHHAHEQGHARHIGDHMHNAGALSDSGGATSGPWVRHTVGAASNQRYERYHHQNTADGSMLAHHHDIYSAMEHFFDDGTSTGTRASHKHTYSAHTHPKGHIIGDDGAGAARGKLYLQHGGGNRAWDHDGATHNHWSSGSLIHQILSVGTAGGSVKLRQHGAAAYHQHGDDGAGNIAHSHAAKGTVWATDGTEHTWYTNTNSNGVQPTLRHVAVGTQAGQVQLQRHNTFGSYHGLGDDGGGALQALSQGAEHFIKVSGGTYTHTHDQHTHTFPSTAYHQAPTTDSSVINTFTPAGAGAIKRASHSTTPQVVGTGSATITTDNNIAHYVWPSGAAGDPHLKLIMACVWDSGAISNPGFYNHVPACAKGTTKAYGQEIYNTSGGGTNSSYVWGTQALAHDSQAWIYATQLGGAGNKAVGTALWAHVVN